MSFVTSRHMQLLTESMSCLSTSSRTSKCPISPMCVTNLSLEKYLSFFFDTYTAYFRFLNLSQFSIVDSIFIGSIVTYFSNHLIFYKLFVFIIFLKYIFTHATNLSQISNLLQIHCHSRTELHMKIWSSPICHYQLQ